MNKRKLTEWLNDNPIPETALVGIILQRYSIDEWPELIQDLNSQSSTLCEIHHVIMSHASLLSDDEIGRLYTQYSKVAQDVTLHGTVPLEALTDKIMWELYNDHYTLDELCPMINELIDGFDDDIVTRLWNLLNNVNIQQYIDTGKIATDIIGLIGDKL